MSQSKTSIDKKNTFKEGSFIGLSRPKGLLQPLQAFCCHLLRRSSGKIPKLWKEPTGKQMQRGVKPWQEIGHTFCSGIWWGPIRFFLKECFEGSFLWPSQSSQIKYTWKAFACSTNARPSILRKKIPRQGERRKIRESHRGGIPSSWTARRAMGVSCIDYISMTMKDSALNDE